MTTGDKIKKSVIYILLVLLAAACLFPFLLMMVNATRDGVEITHFFYADTEHASERKLGDRI